MQHMMGMFQMSMMNQTIGIIAQHCDDRNVAEPDCDVSRIARKIYNAQ